MSELKYPDHFKKEDFDCKCGCGGDGMSQDLLDRLGTLRAIYAEPMIITSGFRCANYNVKVKGHKNSQHLIGKAVDIAVAESNKRYRLVKLAFQLGFTGCGVDGAFVHLDVRDSEAEMFLYS